MPLIFIPVLAGAIGLAFLGTQTAATQAAQNVVSPTVNTASSFPTWVIPTVLVGIGALLLYKEGAKFLKL